MLHGFFDVPTFAFFSQNNVWAGSMYTNFSYKIDWTSDDENGKRFRLRTWYGTENIALVENFEHESFYSFTAEGYDELIAVLNKEFDKFRAGDIPKPAVLNL